MTMHGLSVVDMQGCSTVSCQKDLGRQACYHMASVFSSKVRLNLSAWPFCWSVWETEIWCVMPLDEKMFEALCPGIPPSVWMYRGEQLTSEGLSPVSHRLKMLCSSIFVTYECNKCITGMIVNECKNILGMWAWLNWHRTNEIHVNQCKRSSGPFIRGQKWLISHLLHSTSFAGRWRSRNRDSG